MKKLRIENLEVLIAPVVVLAFAGLLALMYGWVGTLNSVGGETREVPEPAETRIVASTVPAPPGNGDNVAIDTGIGNTQMTLMDVNGTPIPTGIGGSQGNVLMDVGGKPIPTGIGGNQGNVLMDVNGKPIPTGIGGAQGNFQLINQQGASIPYLGLEISNISGAMAKIFGLPPDTGVFVKDVIPNTPAAKAGFSSGDIILKCNMLSVGSLDQMSAIISRLQPGKSIKFVIINHNGRKKSLYAKLTDGPTGVRLAAATKAGKKLWLGMDVQNIDEVMKRQLGLSDRKGVIVSYLNTDSPARTGGIKVGDILRQINGIHIIDAKQFSEIFFNESKTTALSFVVLRQGQRFSLSVKPGRPPAKGTAIPIVPQAEMAVEGSWIGMDVTELNPAEADESGLPEGTQGILVNDVESPPATVVGFQTGDCITAVNSTPTLTMKQFVQATRGQSGAVVDVIRGNRHLYVTVPPPGFTQQGTALKNTQINPLNQIAMVSPAPQKLAVLAAAQDLNSLIADDRYQNSVFIIDLSKNSYGVTPVGTAEQLLELLQHNRIKVVIGTQFDSRTSQQFQAHGIRIYTGVVGRVLEAVKLYQSGSLLEMR